VNPAKHIVLLVVPKVGDTDATGSPALSPGVHLLGTALLPCSCVYIGHRGVQGWFRLP
jgi:hypothetical protein